MGVSGLGHIEQHHKFSNRKQRLFEITKAVALSSKGVGGRNGNNFRIGSVLTNNHSIVSCGTNSYKTSRLLNRFYHWPFYHAESYVILRSGLDACSGCDLYVARVLRNNTLALAKPCDECIKLIELAKIKNVYYSTGEGYARL